jgi:predicted amidophosphoribosyltransferase
MRAGPAVQPAGIDALWSAVPHEGVARTLVGTLKFRGLTGLAGVIAQVIDSGAPARLLRGTVVPVPAAPRRRRARGFDPAELVAAELARLAELPLQRCLRRDNGPRQVGRARAERLAAPPRIEAVSPVPQVALLVDDVMTTGATLAASASALKRAGTRAVRAVTFARTSRARRGPNE